MKKVFIVLSMLLMMSILLAACTPSQPTPPAGEQTKKEIKMAILHELPLQMEPVWLSGTTTVFLSANVFETMFVIGADGGIVNRLCKDYTLSDDGLVYTFNLVDAKWSDGVDITAHDFVYGMKRAAGFPLEKNNYAFYIRDHVKGGQMVEQELSEKGMVPVADQDYLGVRAIDDKTLEITLAERCAYFPSLMTHPIFSPLRQDIATEASADWADITRVDSIPYSGAFVVTELKDKDKIVLEKNAAYFDADKVNIDKITIYAMPDKLGQLNAFRTGEIDVAFHPPIEVVKSYEGDPNLFIPPTSLSVYYIQVNSKIVPLDSVNVRRAVALAIDRDKLVEVLDAGGTKYPLHGMIPKGIPGISGDFRTEEDAKELYLATDVEEAKRLLAEEGYSDSNPLELIFNYDGSQENSDVSQVLQQMWENVGIKVTLNAAEGRAFWSERNAQTFQMMHIAVGAGYPDPTDHLDMYMSSSQGFSFFDSPEYDRLLLQSRVVADPKERMQLLHDAERIIIQEQVYFIPLFGYCSPLLIRENITGVIAAPVNLPIFMFSDIK